MFNFATFYSFEINNASGLDIEDMFVGMYVDADVGYCCDDFVGSDTALGLAYAYNSDDFDDYPSGYGEAPPAVGYVILEGVSVSDDSMDNDEDGLIDEPDERLGMTNFTTMSIGSERSNLWSTPIRLTVRPHHLPTRRQHSSMLNEGGHCSVSSSGCIPTHRTIARR